MPQKNSCILVKANENQNINSNLRVKVTVYKMKMWIELLLLNKKSAQIGSMPLYVFYFDQLLGATGIQKLFFLGKILLLLFLTFCDKITCFSVIFLSENLKTDTKSILTSF